MQHFLLAGDPGILKSLWHASSVLGVNLTDTTLNNLTDVSLNELKHVKHRTSQRCSLLKTLHDTHFKCSNRTSGHPESITRGPSVFRIDITGHNADAPQRKEFRLALLDASY